MKSNQELAFLMGKDTIANRITPLPPGRALSPLSLAVSVSISVSLFHPSPFAMLTWIEKKWFEYHLLTENTVKRLLREGFILTINKFLDF